jgi:hypothetical protein
VTACTDITVHIAQHNVSKAATTVDAMALFGNLMMMRLQQQIDLTKRSHIESVELPCGWLVIG